jgi:hypothetical protein
MRTIVIASLFVLTTACTQGVNTVPDPVKPTDAVRYYDLEVPADMEIKAVDFSATSFVDVGGMNGNTSTTSTGRGFIKAFATHKKTGEQYLLIYEDPANRKQPIQVIHFKSAS